jgi:hypothetical protein
MRFFMRSVGLPAAYETEPKESGAKSKPPRGQATMKRIYFVLLVVLVWSSNLPAQTPFYEGKTVTIRVGFTAGGAFDV